MKTRLLIHKYFMTITSLLVIASPVTYAADTDDIQKDVPKTEVLSTITGDWNNDKQIDSAVLMRNGEAVELYIYLNNKKNELTEVLYKNDVAWSGVLEGTKPYLETNNKQSSLLIYSENTAIGRHRWSQILTIAYRDKSFLVGGYTYSHWDTLELKNTSSCDVNILTGKGLKDKNSFTSKGRKIKLKNWGENSIPKPCNQ